MLELNEARDRLLQALSPCGPVAMPLGEAAGLVLAEPVTADRPIPPYDRAAMDGYALQSADLGPDGGVLACVGEIKAGEEWTVPLQPGTCVGIMTGAVVPPGADAVIEVERTNYADRSTAERAQATGDVVFLTGTRPGQHIAARGEDALAGQTLLEPGAILTPVACGLLALVGHTTVQVCPQPTVALLSTGTEIVAPTEAPTGYQVRDANGSIIAAVLKQAGFHLLSDLGRVCDEPEGLRRAIVAGLEHDVLLLSGGVSRGTSDIVPDILTELGVSCLFSGVAIKPGKPLWAGLSAAGGLVLAMPGNPLAALVHAGEMAVPALRRMAGHGLLSPPLQRAALTEAVSIKGDRLTVLPARITPCDQGLTATPLRGHGSADLAGVAAANGLMFLAPAEAPYEEGQQAEVRVWW